MPDNYHVDKFSFLLAPGGFWIFTTNRSSAEFETGQEICNYIDASLKARSTFSNLFDIAEHFAFHYAYGSEKYIQWEFSGLNPNQDLDIWLLAADGRDSNALLGLARCLRREYMRWTLRTVAFPAEINLGERVEILSSFSSSLKRETDFVYCKDGQLLVPRMVPIPKLKAPFPSAPRVLNMQDPPANHTQIQLVTSSASTNGSLFGFWGRVCHDVRGFKADLIVAGLSSGPLDRLATVDSGTIAPVPCFQGSAMVDADQLAGMAIAVLAPGRNSFLQSRTSQSIVLVTHADSNIGRGIQELYRLHRVPKLICVPSGVTLMELATKGYQNFDLIISGYEYASGLPFIQLLHSLLKPMAGKLFLWNHPTSGVPGILSQDPCAIGDALSIAFELVATFQRSEDLVFDYWDRRASLSPEICSLHSPEAQFSPDKFYILIGGFGSLGVHIARFMYQRGARRIVLTSRRGNFKNKILAVGRMTKCLENLKDLNLSISAVDGSSTEQMTSFFNTFSLGSVGGCIVLTAVLRDKVFASLTTDDFNATFDGKSGVFDALARSTDVSQFDFLIAFTSVSGAFGNQGQANYAAANTALENDVGSLDNGFSFICPGIIDSALMSANSDSGQLSEWSFTSEQMLLSLNDAIYRQQMGQKLTRYIPCLDWGSLDRNIGMHVLGKHLVPEDQAKPQVTSTDNVCEEISRIVQEVLEIPKSDFRTDIPFTAYGIDSLSASRLSFALRSFISISQIQLLADICLNDLYNQLSDVEVAISTETISGPFDGLNGMIEMLSKYTQKSFTRMIGTVSSDADQDKPSTEVVLLTGSMGSLGTEILAQLLVNPEIAGVFAFNRPPPSGSSLERQRMSFILHGHEASLVESPKLVLIEGDFGAKDLGLRIETVGQLKKNVTHIIHAAWAVNFAMPLSGFEDLVKGTQTLMQLAAQSEQSASLSFSYISSVGILQQPKDTSILQEKILSDPEVSLSSGYSSSKWVAEKLVAGNAQTFGLNVNILRVGLIAGSSNGYWDKSHWFPAIVQTAEYLGCLPDGEDHVSWVTCEVASKSIIELRKTSTSQQVLNLVHPRPVKWNDLITVLAECLNVPIVPFAEWFGRLEGSARDDASRPFEKRQGEFRGAYKLLDLFRRGLDPSVNFESMGFLPMASNEMACSLSLTLRNAPSLSRNNVLQWVKSWKEVGVLNAE
ncbi:hypothetical protein VKT23_015881 [Stygiomarasmius scandens]|uniref:Ketoreductase domain-containing protein n=1 Tax=Marasmiellus scandens TaxID=2682957 RepID=A0ABR1IWI8_9AGAR